MFPLKRKRKYPRIYKKGLKTTVELNGVVCEASIKDVSASGCKIVFVDKSVKVNIEDCVKVHFEIHEHKFDLEAKCVRANGFSFIFPERLVQTELNNLILTEYFKDSPELIPVGK